MIMEISHSPMEIGSSPMEIGSSPMFFSIQSSPSPPFPPCQACIMVKENFNLTQAGANVTLIWQGTYLDEVADANTLALIPTYLKVCIGLHSPEHLSIMPFYISSHIRC